MFLTIDNSFLSLADVVLIIAFRWHVSSIATCCVEVDDKGIIVVPLLIPCEQRREHIHDNRWITTQNSDRGVYRANSVIALIYLISLTEADSEQAKFRNPFRWVVEGSRLCEIRVVSGQKCRAKDLRELRHSKPWVLPEWDLLLRKQDLADDHIACTWTGGHWVDISICYFVCHFIVAVLIFIGIKVLINDFCPHL